jgi:uncharacterized protein (UPF0262 family)/protein-tyrosine-phosphatase
MRPLDPETDKLVAVTLDPNTIASIDPDQVHERRIAIYDLLEENAFAPARDARGPFALHLSLRGNHLVLDVRDPGTYAPIAAHLLSLTPFRRLIRDYYRVRESYYEAIRSATPYHIEAVDMGRRGLHNDAAEVLRTRLEGKLIMDANTARRLFTLICAIQPYADRLDETAPGVPGVLFVCSMNSVRSPIAAALARKHFPGRIVARSAGVQTGKIDPFVHDIMEEVGIDMAVHTPHSLDELAATRFDLVVALSDDAPDAIDRAGLDIGAREHWQVDDPSRTEGNREQRRDAYRAVRDELDKRVSERLEALLAAGSQSN